MCRRPPLMAAVATRTRLRHASSPAPALPPSTPPVHPPEEEEVQVIRSKQGSGDLLSPIIVGSSQTESDEEDTSFSDDFSNSMSSEPDGSEDSDFVPPVTTSAVVRKRKGETAVAPKIKPRTWPAYKRRRSSGSPSSPVLIEDDADADDERSESAGDDSDSWTEMNVDKPEPEIDGPYECCDISSDDVDKESGGIEQEADLVLNASAGVPAEKEFEAEDCGISSGDEEDTDRAEAVEVDEENESQYRILFSCLKSDENDCADATQEDADEALCADATNMEAKRSSSNLHTKHENESRESARRRNSHDLAAAAERRETGKPRLSAEERYHVVLNSVTESVNACPSEGTVNPLVTVESENGSEDDVDGDDKPEPSEADKEIEWLYKMLYFSLACDVNDDPADDVKDGGDASVSDAAKKQYQLCELGKHILILEEEVGIVCKFCGFVREEIKHVVAPFHENPFGESRSYYRHDRRNPSDVPDFEDSISDCQADMEDTHFDPAGTIWEIIPGYRSKMYRHQREAFEFIWKNVAGGTELKNLNEHSSGGGGGCLVAHTPGSGKTYVTLAFIKTYMKYYKNARPRPLIIVPAGILMTWKGEFMKWNVGIPFVNMNENELTSEEKAMAASLSLDMSWVQNAKARSRLIKLFIWKQKEAVLALSYSLFAEFFRKDKPFYEIFRKGLLELPSLLVLDEIHVARNNNSNIHKALLGVKTRKRICLSGTPFQNNFRELYNVMCLVRPEFQTMWDKNPFKFAVAKEDEDKIRELEEKMKPFCHGHDSSALHGKVPGLCSKFIYLQPSSHQKQLLWEVGQQKHAFGGDHVINPVCVHPFLLQNPDFAAVGKADIAAGAKARFLLRLIGLCSALEERVLVFSQFITPLNFMKALLECEAHFGWRDGREILFMSGETDLEERKRIMSLLNNPKSDVKVMLASTKACSEGISLTGASRVVLLDMGWNPAVEWQAISRAYRMGQKKVVHAYRIIMRGIHTDISKRSSQTRKTMYSKHVFSWGNEKSVVAGSSMLGPEDVVLERLIEEGIVEEAVIASDR